MITLIMKAADNKSRLFWLRAILVLGAVGCLCVSDSAEPRLLPLPSPTTAETKVLFSASDFASPVPQSSERTAHMAMIAGVQYRPRDRQQHVQPATPALEQSSYIPLITFKTIHRLEGITKPKSVSLSLPIGRAPPRLA